MIKIRQRFPRETIADVTSVIKEELSKEEIIGRIKNGDRVAIAVGSRGIANMPCIVREIVMRSKKEELTRLSCRRWGAMAVQQEKDR